MSRITRALSDLTGRLEAAEHRSTLAISGIDQQAMGVLSRLDGVERDQNAVAARFEGAIDEVREAQDRVAERLRRMEGDDGPRVEAMKALEGALGKVAAQIYEGESRARAQAVEVREDVVALGRRIDRVEAQPIPDLSPVDAALKRLAERVDRIESAPPPVFDTAPTDAAFARLTDRMEDGQHHTSASIRALETAFTGLDERVGTIEASPPPPVPDTRAFDAALARLGERMDEAQARTGAAVKALEASFAGLDQRLARAEADGEAPAPEADEGVRRLEKLASELNEKVETARAEMATRLQDAADGKLDRMEAAVRDLSEQVAATEHRSAEAIDRMGREVVRIAQGLDGRVGDVERRSDERAAQMGGEMARIADAVENRLSRADGAQAEALEKLGGEIAKIAEKLADRIAASERRNAQDLTHGLDEVSEQLQRATDKLNSRYESAAGDLADRIRQSEERTAKLLADARDRVDSTHRTAQAPAPQESGPDPRFSPDHSAEPVSAARTDEPAMFMEEPAFSAGPFGASHEDDLDPFGGFGADDAHRPETAPVAAASDPFAAAVEGFHDDGDRGREPVATMAPPSPTPARPGSTRELIEQARAAARANAERNKRPSRTGRATAGAEELFSTPAPGFEAEEAPALRGRFALPKLRRRETNTTVKTALYASGTAAFLSVAAVGAVTMMGGPRHRAPIEAPTAAPPLTATAASLPSTPILAVAETAPEPLPAPAAEPAPEPLKPRASAPTPTAAASATNTSGRTLYNEAVRELERGDHGALDTLKRAANLGYAPAQFHLGKLYEDGSNGVTKDLVLARRWTERAAKAGDAKAMFNYGLFLANGEGAARDDKSAVDWFRRAADGGVKDAQFNLAVMTQQGRGASANAAEAYKWYLIAAADGDMGARQGAEALKPSLSADAQAAAERSATAYRAQLAATAAATQVRTAAN